MREPLENISIHLKRKSMNIIIDKIKLEITKRAFYYKYAVIFNS